MKLPWSRSMPSPVMWNENNGTNGSWTHQFWPCLTKQSKRLQHVLSSSVCPVLELLRVNWGLPTIKIKIGTRNYSQSPVPYQCYNNLVAFFHPETSFLCPNGSFFSCRVIQLQLKADLAKAAEKKSTLLVERQWASKQLQTQEWVEIRISCSWVSASKCQL